MSNYEQMRGQYMEPEQGSERHFYARFARIFPEESYELLQALYNPQGSSFEELHAQYTSVNSIAQREGWIAQHPRLSGIQPLEYYDNLFNTAKTEETREKQIIAVLQYGNYHIGHNLGTKFFKYAQAEGILASQDECIEIALTDGLRKAITNFNIYSKVNQLPTYFDRVVTNTLHDWMRHEKLTIKPTLPGKQQGKVSSLEALLEQTPSIDMQLATQEQELDEIAEDMELVQKILTLLNEGEKTLFIAVITGHYSDEMAHMLEITESNLKSKIHRLREKIAPFRPKDYTGKLLQVHTKLNK